MDSLMFTLAGFILGYFLKAVYAERYADMLREDHNRRQVDLQNENAMLREMVGADNAYRARVEANQPMPEWEALFAEVMETGQ